jgi:hypothetical protein
MRLAIEYILCYSIAFGLGFIAGVGTLMILQRQDHRRQLIMDRRISQIRRDNGRRKDGCFSQSPKYKRVQRELR